MFEMFIFPVKLNAEKNLYRKLNLCIEEKLICLESR